MVVHGDLNARVGNNVIVFKKGIVWSVECQEEMKVANDYWRCVQSKSWWLVTVG